MAEFDLNRFLEAQERDILPTLPHIHQGTAGEEI